MRDARDLDGDRYGLALAVGFSLLLAAVFGAYFLFVVSARESFDSRMAGRDHAMRPAEVPAAPH